MKHDHEINDSPLKALTAMPKYEKSQSGFDFISSSVPLNRELDDDVVDKTVDNNEDSQEHKNPYLDAEIRK